MDLKSRGHQRDFVSMWEFTWMYGVIAAGGAVGTLIFIILCIGGVYGE